MTPVWFEGKYSARTAEHSASAGQSLLIRWTRLGAPHIFARQVRRGRLIAPSGGAAGEIVAHWYTWPRHWAREIGPYALATTLPAKK
jgi:hypothetical protein